jgi:hypothetical protein
MRSWIEAEEKDPKAQKSVSGSPVRRPDRWIAAQWLAVPNPNPSPEEQADSFLEFVVDAYYDTGDHVVINGKTFYLYRPLGSFGYVAEHDGPVEEWQTDLGGAKEIGDGIYELEIPPDSHVDIQPQIKAIEPPRYAVSVHGGVSIPLLDFADDYGLGINAALDFEYTLIPQLSVAGIFGFNYFWAKDSSVDDKYIMTIAANLRYRPITANPFSFYVGFGPEVLIIHDEDSRFDLGAELGLNYKLSSLITLELGARYHGILDLDHQFLTIDLGGLFRF